MKPDISRLVEISVTAVAVILLLVIAVPLFQETLRQPRITMTEMTVFQTSCGLVGTTQTYSFRFTLVNSGDADGYANVQRQLDGVNRADDDILVPAGDSVDRVAELHLEGCANGAGEAVLAGFRKA